jgi:hypothetical protein
MRRRFVGAGVCCHGQSNDGSICWDGKLDNRSVCRHGKLDDGAVQQYALRRGRHERNRADDL